jgi:hypothetical protein
MDRRNVFPTVISLLAQIVSLRESNIFNRLKTWKEAASSTASHCIRPVFFAHIGNVLLFMVTNLRWYVFLFSNSASVLFLISAFHDAWFIHVVQVQVSIAFLPSTLAPFRQCRCRDFCQLMTLLINICHQNKQSEPWQLAAYCQWYGGEAGQ